MADKMLKIELKKSLIGRGAKQIATAEALGLRSRATLPFSLTTPLRRARSQRSASCSASPKPNSRGYTHNEAS